MKFVSNIFVCCSTADDKKKMFGHIFLLKIKYILKFNVNIIWCNIITIILTLLVFINVYFFRKKKHYIHIIRIVNTTSKTFFHALY